MMIQACLNGGRGKEENPAVPVTPRELAEDAVRVRQAGASELHFHPRDSAGGETLEPHHVAASIEAIRDAVPGMPIGVGTGSWIPPGGSARLEHVRKWAVRPDYASVNLNEADAENNMALLTDMDIGIEAGIWSHDDAEQFVELEIASNCLRVLLEMISDDPAKAEAEYGKCMDVLRTAGLDVPILLHGVDGSVWPMVKLAREQGHDTRVGFEDGFLLPDGSVARSNADLVRQACRLAH